MRKIKEIICHCTATPEGREVTVKDVDSWHRARKFNGISYHYLIYLDGSIHIGRAIERQGAHCSTGGHNRYSVGVCYVSGLAKDGKTAKDTRTSRRQAYTGADYAPFPDEQGQVDVSVTKTSVKVVLSLHNPKPNGILSKTSAIFSPAVPAPISKSL